MIEIWRPTISLQKRRRPGRPGLKAQRDAALLQLGLDPATAELDHDPALGLRERTPDGGYIPDANDPRYLVWRTGEAHRKKTSGNKATTAGSDINRIAKVNRIAPEQAAFRERLLKHSKKRAALTAKPKRPWPSRPFEKKRG